MHMQFAPSVNYHLWQPCNFRCRYCFATFADAKAKHPAHYYLSCSDSKQLIRLLADSGFKKITFAGGEPSLCPWIEELFDCAKQCGMTTMMVTNGSRLDEAFLHRNKGRLDWIALSIDSLSPCTNFLIGRYASNQLPFDRYDYMRLVNLIKIHRYRLKINTVVSSVNCGERLVDFINVTRPERWKVLQVLPVQGQNDDEVDRFIISEAQFKSFLHHNRGVKRDVTVVPESCQAIQGSYLMIDPLGRFFDDTEGRHTYSSKILAVGVEQALSEIRFDPGKFHDRKGLYDW